MRQPPESCETGFLSSDVLNPSPCIIFAADEAERLISEGLIQPTIQTFQAPGGATTKKAIYKIYYRYGYPLGDAAEEPTYVKFDGGKLELRIEAIEVLDSL